MLIPLSYLLNHFNPKITGIFHVGAHECEELRAYIDIGIHPDKIFWIEAMQNKVDLMRSRGVPNVFQALVDDIDGKTVEFKVTNNGESSSMLDFGSHAIHHPHVHVVSSNPMNTTRLDTFIESNHIPIQSLNFLNLDIQGVELRALKSMEKYLTHIEYIYTEVNSEHVYKDCNLIGEIDVFLSKHGFSRVCTKMCGNYGWGDAFYVKTI
jgi:FkbM family methyltransferase